MWDHWHIRWEFKQILFYEKEVLKDHSKKKRYRKTVMNHPKKKFWLLDTTDDHINSRWNFSCPKNSSQPHQTWYAVIYIFMFIFHENMLNLHWYLHFLCPNLWAAQICSLNIQGLHMKKSQLNTNMTRKIIDSI